MLITYDTFAPDGSRTQTTKEVESPSQAEINADALRTKARQALSANAAYLALATPTAAQTTQQVQRLTRECSALIRMMMGMLDDVSDT